MILLEMMILVAFAGAFLVYLAGKISSQLRNSLAVILSLVLVIFMSLVYRSIHLEVKYFSFLGHPLLFRIDWFSWFFGISIVVINFFAIIFSLSDMNG